MLLLHWIGQHPDGGCPEDAARDLGLDVVVAERLFADLASAGYIATSRA
jgi:hypothetical protein